MTHTSHPEDTPPLPHASNRIPTGIATLPIPLHKKIARSISRCTIPWQLIEEHDRILIGFSGGKDSLLLIHFLDYIRRIAPVQFEIGIFHLNPNAPQFPAQSALLQLQERGFHVWHETIDMSSILAQKIQPGDSPCGLCSRLRRGILYTQAQKNGYNKIALGHHRDDAIETLLMNLLYCGQTKSMPPKLLADNGMTTVIRPFLYTPEAWLIEASQYLDIPVTKMPFCTREHTGARYETKQLLAQLEKTNPKVKGNLLHALHHVVPDHLLDRSLMMHDSNFPQT
jgi:tRNA 2-thiocytidine biosynthesis protein TtcA